MTFSVYSSAAQNRKRVKELPDRSSQLSLINRTNKYCYTAFQNRCCCSSRLISVSVFSIRTRARERERGTKRENISSLYVANGQMEHESKKKRRVPKIMRNSWKTAVTKRCVSTAMTKCVSTHVRFNFTFAILFLFLFLGSKVLI